MAGPPLRQTRTYAVLEVSPTAYEKIRKLLEQAGYEHAFQLDEGKVVIDMHGIALSKGEAVR